MGRNEEKKRFYHVNSAGENVVFRDADDFIEMMNDIALVGYRTDSEMLVFNVLSTHFHLCTETEHVDKFIKDIKLSYTRYFQNKYGISGKVMDVEAWEKTDVVQKANTINYVLKNAVHHEVSISPFKYPYSSIGCYFKKQLTRDERFLGDYQATDLIHPSELRGRERRAILKKHDLPDKYLIQNRRLIVPESYIYTRMVEAFYNNNHKSFLYEMNRNPTENTEMVEPGKRFVTTESLMISSQRISDMEVCKMINDYVTKFQHRSFKEFTSDELSEVSKYLQRSGASNYQIKRCLWQE